MAYTCCLVPTAIASVVTVLNPCPIDFGQIQKIIFWRRGNTMATTLLTVNTGWTALTTATDATKALVSPWLGEVVVTPGKIREYGSANQTPNGIPFRKGREATKVTAKIQRQAQAAIISSRLFNNGATRR